MINLKPKTVWKGKKRTSKQINKKKNSGKNDQMIDKYKWSEAYLS